MKAGKLPSPAQKNRGRGITLYLRQEGALHAMLVLPVYMASAEPGHIEPIPANIRISLLWSYLKLYDEYR
jgi:hypothetical protein